uniref:Uncharacterized protein n=1 Tax=Serinus canaria TaxID=9135 RepID=A0A8C9MTS7_SERCA
PSTAKQKMKKTGHRLACRGQQSTSRQTQEEKRVRISRSSDSTSFFASSLSELIKLKAMTSPRCWTSKLSCKQSLCRISSHWVVSMREQGKEMDLG